MPNNQKKHFFISAKWAFAAGLVAVGLQTGCGKSEEEAPAAPEAAAPEAAAPEQQQTAPAEPIPAGGNAEAQFARADDALKKKDYEAAVDSMLQAQFSGAIQTEAQRWSYADKMRAMQDYIAQGVAAGDPRAIRAQQLLNRMATPR